MMLALSNTGAGFVVSVDNARNTTVPSSSSTIVSPFGGRWFLGRDDFDIDQTDKKMEWNIPHTHLENDGVVTHFDAVELEEGKSVRFKMRWTSKGENNKDGCDSKYWTESKYLYQCYDESREKDGEDPWISECAQQVECLVNTGDFRIVLADSNGDKVDKDGFGSLDDASHNWQGFHWRMFPHTGTKLTHKSPAIPCSIYFRKHSGGMFSSKTVSKESIFEGCFDVGNDKRDTLELTVHRKSSKEFELTIKMNEIGYSYTHEFDNSDYVPHRIDTLAIAEPNLRGYTLLKLEEDEYDH